MRSLNDTVGSELPASDAGEGVNPVEFVILGRTSLWIDGQSIPLGAAKQRGMLGLLLYYVRVPVRIDTIMAHLWAGQRASDVGRASLYALVSRIRHVLAVAGLGDVLTRSEAVSA